VTEFVYHNAGATQAQQYQFLSYLFNQSTTGLVVPGVLTGLAVSQTSTASGQVLVAAGAGVAQDVVLSGASGLCNPSQKTQDVFTANPANTLPRNDIVVFDAATKTISVVTGTPNASPTDPTVPATAFPLARLRHAANATTIPNAKIDDLRSIITLSGAIPIVASLADMGRIPTVTGAVCLRSDERGRRYFYDGTAWIGQVRSESGVLSHAYGGGVGPVSSSVTFGRPFTAVPALTISCNTYVLQTYYGSLSTAGVTVSSRGFNSVIPASGTYSISWTATGW
jgi:hypothetical protein